MKNKHADKRELETVCTIFVSDPLDLPEMGGRTAGPKLSSTSAGGQDDVGYTNSPKWHDMRWYDML